MRTRGRTEARLFAHGRETKRAKKEGIVKDVMPQVDFEAPGDFGTSLALQAEMTTEAPVEVRARDVAPVGERGERDYDSLITCSRAGEPIRQHKTWGLPGSWARAGRARRGRAEREGLFQAPGAWAVASGTGLGDGMWR